MSKYEIPANFTKGYETTLPNGDTGKHTIATTTLLTTKRNEGLEQYGPERQKKEDRGWRI